MLMKEWEMVSKKISFLTLTLLALGSLVRDLSVNILAAELATRADNFNS